MATSQNSGFSNFLTQFLAPNVANFFNQRNVQNQQRDIQNTLLNQFGQIPNVASSQGIVNQQGSNIFVLPSLQQRALQARTQAATEGIFGSFQEKQDFEKALAEERIGFDRRKQREIDEVTGMLRGQGRLGTTAGAEELAAMRQRFEEQEQAFEKTVRERHFKERQDLYDSLLAGSRVQSEQLAAPNEVLGQGIDFLKAKQGIQEAFTGSQNTQDDARNIAFQQFFKAFENVDFFDKLKDAGDDIKKRIKDFFDPTQTPPTTIPQTRTPMNVPGSPVTNPNFLPQNLPPSVAPNVHGGPVIPPPTSATAGQLQGSLASGPFGPGQAAPTAPFNTNFIPPGTLGGGAGAGAITTGVPLQGSLAGGGPFGPSIAAAKTVSGLGTALGPPSVLPSVLAGTAGTTAATVGGLAGSASAVPFTAAAVPGVGLALAAMAFVGKFSSGMTPKNHAEGLAVSLSALGKQNSNMVLPGSGNTMSLQAVANLPMQILRAKGHDPRELVRLGAPPQLANLINHPLMLRTKSPGTPGGFITTGGGKGGATVGNILDGIGTPQFNLVMDTLRQMNAPGFANVQAQVNAHLAKKKQSAAVQLNRP